MRYLKNTDNIIGIDRLSSPLLNKNTAFSLEEREKYQLFGLLPSKVETLNEQLNRAKQTFDQAPTPIAKHIFLRALQDINETLFYRFLYENIETTMPIVYTPTVGQACEQFSRIYRKPRGIFLSYPERQYIPQLLKNIKKTRDIRAIVMTDGERILGLGDQGLGGMGIPIGKLSLYSLCGGIHPAYTLPILLDVGTNNQDRIKDNDYLGWKHPRLTGDAYYQFLNECIEHIHHTFPNVLLQFEDFAQQNAYQLLRTYQNKICSFNDDIQGTAAVTGGTILAAIKKSKTPINKQKIVFFGAGAAGCGIATLIIELLKNQGITEFDAKKQIFMIDRAGLLHDKIPNLLDFQKPLAQCAADIEKFFSLDKPIQLIDVVNIIKPTVLIGVSGQPKQFTQEIIEKLATYNQHPIIFPLSNPNERCEACPQDLINWTQGRAIIATGSPFPVPQYNNQNYMITQCNNSYIFPGIGLGVLAGGLSQVTTEMFVVAALKLSELSPKTTDIYKNLLPSLNDIRQVSLEIAVYIILQGIKQGLCSLKEDEQQIRSIVKEFMWTPNYE